MADKIDNRTLWNIAAIVVLCVIVLAIGIFIGRTLTMNTQGNPAIATVSPDDSSVITLPSASPTASATPYPGSSATPAASPSATATSTPAATPTPTPTPTPTSTPTPTPTSTPTPTPTSTPTPTPTPTPPPIDIVQDAPFYESITPLKEKDQFSLAPVENSYIAGDGPLYLDLDHSYMGSGYAYPGDTIGVKLKVYNDGPAMDKTALVTMNLSKMVNTPYGSYWLEDIINQQTTTRITVGDYTYFTKNLSYTVPNTSGLKGFYKIYVKFYVDGQFNAGFIKELNILDP